MTQVDRVVVAVPVRDEEGLLPSCLEAVGTAVDSLRARCPDVRVVVAVALDGCADESARVAAGAGVAVVALPGSGVGAARDAAVRLGLDILGVADEASERRTWVACTDADTLVPPHWLTRQVLWADQRLDLVIGTVEPFGVDDPGALAAWHARHELREGHGHVHGANLGVRASTWHEAGGFGPRLVGEDVALVTRVRALTDRWVATDTTRVRTSGRAHSRVVDGFADYLSALSSDAG